MNGLLRLFESHGGPIAALESVPLGSRFWTSMWCTRAKLSAQYDTHMAGIQAVPRLVHAWHRDKAESQRAALDAGLAATLQVHASASGVDARFAASGVARRRGQNDAVGAARMHALCKVAGAWLSEQLLERLNLPLRRIALKHPPWLPRHAGSVCAWEIVWFGAQKCGTYVLAAYQAQDGGLFVGCGCHALPQRAAQQAMLQVWRRMQRFEQVCNADEPLLDTLHEQRLWGYATDPELANAALTCLHARETQKMGALPLPDVVFEAEDGSFRDTWVAQRCVLAVQPRFPMTPDTFYFWEPDA